jgi:hypothetical protein
MISQHIFRPLALLFRARADVAARESESILLASGEVDFSYPVASSDCEMAASSRQKVVVVGAGPVGSLAALYAASRGDEVEVYELRGGMFQLLTRSMNPLRRQTKRRGSDQLP